MGQMSPRVLISDKEFFIAIRAYLDRSGAANTGCVSLAAFGAPDDVWARFEKGWYEILKTAPSPIPYMHMKEAMQRWPDTPFSYLKGWNKENAWTLVFKLAKFMSEFSPNELLRFSCTVDMDAWRKLTAEGLSIPSEVDICNYYCVRPAIVATGHSIMMAQQTEIVDITGDDLIHFVFDRSEPFFEKFRAEWNVGKDEFERTGKYNMWRLVDSVTEGNMKTTPGIQAADILAWGLNRENTAPEGTYGTGLANILQRITAGSHAPMDEAQMRRVYGRTRGAGVSSVHVGTEVVGQPGQESPAKGIDPQDAG
jgi:hypothetical protein